MNARTIPRTAVDSYLKLVRLPLDGVIGLLPGNGTGAKPAAKLALDRADASIRAMIATILGDQALREDAEERRSAADGREFARRLREKGSPSGQADARRRRAASRVKTEHRGS